MKPLVSLLPKIIFITSLITLLVTPATAEGNSYSISGRVTDELEQPLQSANVALFTASDTLLIRGTPSGDNGEFVLRDVPAGNYNLVVSYLGYHNAMIPLEIGDRDITGLHIRIREETMEFEDVVITARPDPVQIRGDTVVYSAAAFPVHSDALAEDLIRRMPGFTITDGRLSAQGEEVQQVLVDGEEFFGRDPGIALRNLPAEIIRQIEVFDQASDQAEFTGFDDGESIRTVNIITRGGIRDGQFGRTNASIGTDERYLGGGNINLFSGDRRISILGLTNNINQLNFTSDDLAGVAQSGITSGGRSGRGGMGAGGGMGGGGGTGGGSGDWSGPDNTSDFLLSEQQGINTVHSFGINYVDRWNDSWRISSSYFFNNTVNSNDRTIERQFVDDRYLEDQYHEVSRSASEQYNHRFNARINVTVDSLRSLVIRPQADFRLNSSDQILTGITLADTDRILNEMTYSFDSDRSRYNLNSSILYRRRFGTPGRTFSVNLMTQSDNSSGDQFQNGESLFYDATTYTRTDDQNIRILTENRSVRASFQYTEPLTESSQLMIGYTPSLEFSNSERNIYLPEESTGQFVNQDPLLSNEYNRHEISHIPNAGYRLRGDAFHFNASLAWQYTQLEGEQVYPHTTESRHTFSNLLPRAMLLYRFSDATNIRFMYHTRSQPPSVVQLQDVIDNTDPLMWSGGNPDLNEQYAHRFNIRYRSVNSEKQTSHLGFANITYTQNHIGNRTFQPVQDTLLAGNILLNRGTRYTIPDNTGPALDMRSFFNYSRPVSFLRSNLNLNTGIRFRRSTTIFNDEKNIGRQTGLDAGMIINSTISRELDFTFSYNAGYQLVRNTILEDLDNDYYTGRASVRLNTLPWEWLILSSDLNILHYHGLADDFNRNIYYWNASVGYRFLNNRAAQFRITVSDILGQNSSINRMVTDMYIQDVQSDVLTRYVLLSLTYNFRAFQEGR